MEYEKICDEILECDKKIRHADIIKIIDKILQIKNKYSE